MEEATGRLSETARLTATPPASFYQSLVTLRDQSGPGLRKRQRRVRNLVADPLPRAAGSRFLRWSSLVNPRYAEPLPRGRRRERCAEAARQRVCRRGSGILGPAPFALGRRASNASHQGWLRKLEVRSQAAAPADGVNQQIDKRRGISLSPSRRLWSSRRPDERRCRGMAPAMGRRIVPIWLSVSHDPAPPNPEALSGTLCWAAWEQHAGRLSSAASSR